MSSTRRLYTFFVEGDIFSSPNSSIIPIVPLRVPIDPQNLDSAEVLTPRWADARYPGFPFIALSPRFDVEPFRCLGPPRGVFPVENLGSSWRLAPATIRSFKVLENDLYIIEKSLRSASASTLNLPSCFTRFPLPRAYGYETKHPTKDAVQACAVKSRNAFLSLMGLCSFLMAHFHQQEPGRAVDIMRWEPLLYQAKFKLDYIQLIKACELVDFSASYPRAGIFIDHFDTDFQHYVSMYTQCNVPVWIRWGAVNLGRPDHHGVLGEYLPYNAEVDTALRATHITQEAATSSGDQVVESVVPPCPINEPEPERFSEQKRGELWHEFFARMDKKREEAIGKEDSEKRQKRLARERDQAVHPVPGLRSKAPSIFEWTEDEKTGFLLRKSRRYNSVRHEWDLCEALAPNTTKIIIVPEAYEDSDSDDEFTYKQPKECGSVSSPVPPVIQHSVISLTPPPAQPRALNDLASLPSPPKVQDYISSITSPESTPHSPIPSSSTAIDPAVLAASRDLIPSTALSSSYNCESSPISPAMPLPTLALVDAGDPIPSSFTAIDPAIFAASRDLIPLTALSPSYNCESSPISPAMPLPTLALEDAGETVSAHEVHGEAVEASAADSAEPGEMHSLIYDGSPSPISSLSFTDTLLDDIYMRYGFIGSHGDGNDQQDTLRWSDVQKIFGNVESHTDNSLQAPISRFLEGILHLPSVNPLDQLPSLWDLADSSILPFTDHINPWFRLVVRHDGAQVIYLIETKNCVSDDVPWQLMLNDAATVLECYRQEQAMSIRDIATFLLQRGRPFSTRIKRSQFHCSSPLHSKPLLVLGWRPNGHKPTVDEYNFYEHHRKTFFQHPRSRAALLKGGIIWRHALECVGAIPDERALEGPSNEALVFGSCLTLPDGIGSLWDDDLSEADMNLICGVYKYETGWKQTADLSWWPKQSTFLKSGLWPGYWSRSCEDWYQHRHNAIASGNGDLKTANQWYKALILYQKVSKLRQANNKAASFYIERHGNLLE